MHVVTRVVAASFYIRKEAEDYVERCYTKASYLVAYNGSNPTLTSERRWPKVEKPLDPPLVKIGPDRPRIDQTWASNDMHFV